MVLGAFLAVAAAGNAQTWTDPTGTAAGTLTQSATFNVSSTSGALTATAAVIDGELVIIPQPRLTFVLPVASIPVTGWLSRLITQ